jgi:hypothetical protein
MINITNIDFFMFLRRTEYNKDIELPTAIAKIPVRAPTKINAINKIATGMIYLQNISKNFIFTSYVYIKLRKHNVTAIYPLSTEKSENVAPKLNLPIRL